jgi:hypothetical protein
MKLNRNELSRLRTEADPADVMQEFFDNSINADQIPMDSFCVMGGAPDHEDSADVQVLDCETSGDECKGELTVFFNEVVYGGGCPDMPTRKPRQGDVSFKVCLEDGTVTFD